VGQDLLIQENPKSHTTTPHTRQDSTGRVISSSQKPPSDNTQHSQETDIHVRGGIRTHNLSRRAASDRATTGTRILHRCKTQYNTILLPTPLSSKWSFPFSVSN
jgi:hypothetical protein